MGMKVHCNDLGFDCDGVVEAETEEEFMQKVAAHAKEAHDVNEVTPELVAKVKAATQMS